MKEFWRLYEKLKPVDGIKVNNLLWCHLEDNKLFIHIANVRSKALFEKRDEFFCGLTELADTIENGSNPAFVGVEFIFAISPLVKRRPSLLPMLGFSVFDFGSDEENKRQMEAAGIFGYKLGMSQKDEGIAVATKAQFLERRWGLDGARRGTQNN